MLPQPVVVQLLSMVQVAETTRLHVYVDMAQEGFARYAVLEMEFAADQPLLYSALRLECAGCACSKLRAWSTSWKVLYKRSITKQPIINIKQSKRTNMAIPTNVAEADKLQLAKTALESCDDARWELV